MKRTFVIIVSFLTMAYVFPQKIEQSKVSFKIKNIGTYAKGTFSESTITGSFNTNDLDTSVIKAVIQVNSVDTGIKKRDKHLLEDDYFDVAKYPTIEFYSTKIEKRSEIDFVLHGKLTIKKTTRVVQLPLVITNNGNSITVNSSFMLRRRDYGVGSRSWILSDKVKAQVQFTVKKL